VLARREKVERKLAELIVASWRYAADRDEEALAARQLYRVAAAALDQQGRENLRARLSYDVPVKVGADGVEAAARPSVGLFDGEQTSWLRIGQLLGIEPRHARGELQGTALGHLVEQVENTDEVER
jgi:hypothetical protein